MSVKLQELVKVLYQCQLEYVVDKANVIFDSDDYRVWWPATGGTGSRRTRDLVALPLLQAGRCREKFKEPTDEVTYHDILPYELLIDDGQSCAKTLERKKTQNVRPIVMKRITVLCELIPICKVKVNEV